jgi:hypothetical protein
MKFRPSASMSALVIVPSLAVTSLLSFSPPSGTGGQGPQISSASQLGGIVLQARKYRKPSPSPSPTTSPTTSPSPSPSPTSSPTSSPTTSPTPTSTATPTSCGGPITITQGGTYTGCWVSNGQGTAVTVATSSPVTITNSVIKGTSKLVQSSVAHVKLTITHSTMQGLYPGGNGVWGDYSVYLDGFDYLTVENNAIEQKAGIKVNNWSGYSSAHPVLIRYNTAHNIDGRYTDGNGGYQSGNAYLAQFVQFDTVQNAPGIDISWNSIVNDPNNSRVEDNISMFNSSGTSGSPIDIHDNLIRGGYPYPATYSNYAGGGISLGDHGGNYEIAHDNTVLSTTNGAIYIASGQNQSIYNNRVADTGTLSDGTKLPAANVGVSVWNEYTSYAWGNNQAYNNTAGWMNASAQRNDWWNPDCSGSCSNTHLNNNQNAVTWSDIQNEVTLWNNKAAAAGVVLGP